MPYGQFQMASQEDPDVALMLRVKQGDMSAFEELVNKYKQPVINLLGRTLADPAEAEDVAQNVFIQVYKSAHRYQATARFSTWLYTIARNLCLNEIRRRSRHRTESFDAPPEDGEDHPSRQYEEGRVPSPPAAMLQNELTVKVEEAMADLPEAQRTAILLFREEEMSYEEIARVLRTSVSATKSLIHRGRETLKARLKAYLKTGFWSEKRPQNREQL